MVVSPLHRTLLGNDSTALWAAYYLMRPDIP